MARYALLALVIAATLVGCGRKKATPVVEEDPATVRKNIEAGIRKNVPVLDRTIVMQELDQIHLFYYSAYSASGKWPKDTAAAREMMKNDAEMRKLFAKIDDGTYVVVGNPPEGGILAYCTKETTVGLISISTNHDINQHKPDELQKLIAQQRR